MHQELQRLSQYLPDPGKVSSPYLLRLWRVVPLLRLEARARLAAVLGLPASWSTCTTQGEYAIDTALLKPQRTSCSCVRLMAPASAS